MHLTISSLRNGKDLLDPYKDHPFHKGLIDEETLIIMAKRDNSFKDENEQTKGELNLDSYNPPIPYSQALNRPRAKVK